MLIYRGSFRFGLVARVLPNFPNFFSLEFLWTTRTSFLLRVGRSKSRFVFVFVVVFCFGRTLMILLTRIRLLGLRFHTYLPNIPIYTLVYIHIFAPLRVHNFPASPLPPRSWCGFVFFFFLVPFCYLIRSMLITNDFSFNTFEFCGRNRRGQMGEGGQIWGEWGLRRKALYTFLDTLLYFSFCLFLISRLLLLL